LIKIPLQGEGVTATSPFEDALTAAGLTGERASPTAKPYHDGIENLLKFAFNMDLTGPISHALMPAGGTSGLPLISLEQNGLVYFLRFEFVRRTGSGLSYMPQTSEELNSASWIPLNATPQISQIDASWERVVYEEEITVSNSPMLFGRVVVSMP
jgi:hypothetical protein